MTQRAAPVEWAVFGLALLALALLLPGYAGFFHDDAFITLRYAARWLAGAGPTWNDGERVEGFTHPLWLIEVTALSAAIGSPVVAARALGVAHLLGLVAIWRSAGASWLFVLPLACLPSLLLWSWGGLETVGLCFWLVVGAAAAERAAAAPEARAWAAGALAGLAFAVAAGMRPEGGAAGVIAALLLGATGHRRAAAGLLGVLFALGASYLVVRLAYYGDVLPNTARAKLGGIPLGASLEHGASYLRATVRVWAPALAAAAVLVVRVRGTSSRVEVLAAFLLVAAALSGGDHMPGGRLVVPAAALLLFAAGRRAARAPDADAPLLVGLAIVVAVLQLALVPGLPRERDSAARRGEVVGRFLAAALPAGSSVAAASAGALPYFAPELRFIDTLGLNDRSIARREPVPLRTRWQLAAGHRKGDGAYVLERRPDVVILGPAEGALGEDPRAWFLTGFELLASPEFREQYGPFGFALGDDVVLTAWLRRDSAAARGLAAKGAPLRPPPLPAR